MTDRHIQTTLPRHRLRAGLLAASLACGTALGGIAMVPHAALAQNAIQPSGMAQKIPDFVDLVKQVRPAVVSITSMIKDDGSDDDELGGGQGGGQGGGMGGGQQMPFPFPFPFPMQPQNRGSRIIEARGSGFIISADGYIVTNNHVIKNATSVSVTLDDGTVLKAKVIGHDAGTDLALLKVKPSSKLSFIGLGESDDVQPGQWVIAVGNPFGLGGSVTAGIVSARGRDIGDGPYDSFIQVDAPINRGNSGGPLITQDGKVVGVNTAIYSPSGGSVGIGFAIPSDVVKNVVAQLEKTGHVTRGYLGVTAQEITPAMAKALSLPTTNGAPATGALVASVNSGSPAEKVGIKPGDVIISFNGQKVASPRDLAIKVSSVAPDSKAQVSWLRNGNTQSATVTVGNLAKHSDQAGGGNGSGSGNGSIGVTLSSISPDLRQQLGIDDSVKGVVVRDVRQGSAADQAGLSAGDVIVAVGNKTVTTPKEAADAVHAAIRNGGTVALRVLHQGQMLFVAITPDNGSGSGDNGQSGDNGNSGSGDDNGDGNGGGNGNGGGDSQPG